MKHQKFDQLRSKITDISSELHTIPETSDKLIKITWLNDAVMKDKYVRFIEFEYIFITV